MNEQFSELRKQAFDIARQEMKENDPGRYYSDQSPDQSIVNQKFAELIVRECVFIVQDAVDHREPASTYVGKIKQHFGVE